MATAYNRRIERGWQQTRLLATYIHNNAFGRKRQHMRKPTDLFTLDLDNMGETELMSKEKYLELVEKWQIRGEA